MRRWLWAALALALDVCAPSDSAFLVIGIKSSVMRGRAQRQAIRATWAAPELTTPLGVHVVFLGGEPDASVLAPAQRQEVARLIENEKASYGDLLTHELGCRDSFFALVDKTIAFMHYSANHFPSADYMMLADDDAYVRVDRIVAALQSRVDPAERFYGGSIAPPTVKPIRDQSSRYFLGPGTYPVSEFLPYVNGASYIVSRDIVRFVARNRRHLRGLSGLDDVSMAFWLRATMNIQPHEMPQVRIMRLTNCTDDIAVYADLSPQALQRIHGNLASARSFCEGFDLEAWSKEYETIRFPSLEIEENDTALVDATLEREGDVRIQWDLQIQPDTGVAEIVTAVEVKEERVVATYVPSSGMYGTTFCNRIIMLLQMQLNVIVGTGFCNYHRVILVNYLRTLPQLSHVVRQALHNLEHYSLEQHTSTDAVVVRYVGMDEQRFHALRLAVNCFLLQLDQGKPLVWENEGTGEADVAVVPTVRGCPVSAYGAGKTEKTSAVLCISDRLIGPPGPRGVSTAQRLDVSASLHAAVMYLPAVSFAFGAIFNSTPSLLLEPYPLLHSNTRRIFCAHGFHRRDLDHQQRMLELLERVDSVRNVPHRLTAAGHEVGATLDEAVDAFKAFRFVLAFEDEIGVPGLISETIALAFLAGAVPIYLGHSASVSWLFNPRAFIDCGAYRHLEDCVNRVVDVHRSTSLFEAMRMEAPIGNRSALEEVFSWHPSVNDRQRHGGLGATVAQLLGL